MEVESDDEDESDEEERVTTKALEQANTQIQVRGHGTQCKPNMFIYHNQIHSSEQQFEFLIYTASVFFSIFLLNDMTGCICSYYPVPVCVFCRIWRKPQMMKRR